MPVCAACGQSNPEGARFCNACAAPLAALEPREQRKTVTVVFCDVTGSTQLGESTDPEALRGLLAGYFERMKEIVESHGGVVEKFIGDAVMAVFGVPVVHEDDALRACRAALEMRHAFPSLGINGRIGVNTGEVVTGTMERLATGDAVNVAARLEQAAAPGEILVGAETLRLVRSAVEVGEERRLELKGKSAPQPAFPLQAAVGELERRFATPMVGRDRELQGLRAAFARTREDRSCQLFTILGSAGVGKSRLAAEFITPLDALVVRGRCLSYGEGITYWPVVEILKQLDRFPAGDAARPLRSLLGETDMPASAEEIAWGFRKLLEQEAQERALVVVFDDLHWAEETLLELVEHVADLARAASILLLCMARPELIERRPSWGGGKWNATSVLLEPLDAAETEKLLAELGYVPSGLHDRIVEVAEGNPLFLEEMLGLVRDSGPGEVAVPPTIQALLAARLDQLDAGERTVLEHGSVEGRIFHRGAVAALADGDASVDQRLVALVRKELVRPDRPQLPGDDAYRFRHLLIRDAAYDALPKATRAMLHRRFASWLEQHGGSLVELDEILGYHLEQAARYLDELGRSDVELAVAAGERLAVAGRRALSRDDIRAAANLIERALLLTRPLRLDVHLELDLAHAHGRDPRRALAISRAAAERAAATGDATGEALARVIVALHAEEVGESTPDEVEALALAALPLLEEADDQRGLSLAWHGLAYGVANMRGQWEEMALAAEKAIRYSRLTGHLQHFALEGGLVLGSSPADEALRRLDALPLEVRSPLLQLCRAWLLAMLDRFDEAWPLALEQSEQWRERAGDPMGEWFVAEIAALAGDHADAANRLEVLCSALEEHDQRALLSTYAPRLGRTLCILGRHGEAMPLARAGRELGDPQDAVTQMLWRQVEALVIVRQGNHEEAERLAREAVAISDTTDGLNFQGDTRHDLAEVLLAGGRRREAATALSEAAERYAQKKNIPLARHARERLTGL